MLSRINLLSIIRDHYRTLKSLNQNYEFINIFDFILFILSPIIFAICLTYNGYTYENQIGNLIAATSIFGGFLFNLLAIIYGQIDKIREDAKSDENKLKKKFVKEIHINISYAIVVALLIILFLFITTFDSILINGFGLIKKIVITICYALMFNFVLTLLMVLNRVYILLKKDSE